MLGWWVVPDGTSGLSQIGTGETTMSITGLEVGEEGSGTLEPGQLVLVVWVWPPGDASLLEAGNLGVQDGFGILNA